MRFDTSQDDLLQSVSNAINQFQPNYGKSTVQNITAPEADGCLERTLRTELSPLSSCQLRLGCEVLSRSEQDDTITVEYRDRHGEVKQIRASWLVGADGKRGIVRKNFLEPEGILQQVGL